MYKIPNRKLTNNFWLYEFIRSNAAKTFNLDNTPTKEQIENILLLCIYVLQPLRSFLKSAVEITSGLRRRKVNRKIGGSDTSHHITACAADFRSKGNLLRAFNYIRKYLNFTELIYEFPGTSYAWIHVAFKKGREFEKKILVAIKKNGRTVYLNWKDPETEVYLRRVA